MFDFGWFDVVKNVHISISMLNIVAGFYFVFTRSIGWSNLNEATMMENQSKWALVFCCFVSGIYGLEMSHITDLNLIIWYIVLVAQIFIGMSFGICVDRVQRV